MVRGVGISAWAIDLVEKSEWCHVISALDEDHYLDPVFPVIESRSGEMGSDVQHWYVSPDINEAQRNYVVMNLNKYVGKPYSLLELAITGLSIFIPSLRKHAIRRVGVVCSTALAWSYFNAGCFDALKVGDVSPDSVTPALLARAWGAPDIDK